MRHAGAGRDQSGVVQRVDHLRALARVVVDLLVRAGGEEARERVDDGQKAVAREPTGYGHHVLLGDAALEEALRIRLLEAAHATVGREVGVEHDERRIPGGQLDERLAVSVDDVLAADRDACPAPLSGSASSAVAGSSSSTGRTALGGSTGPIRWSSSLRARSKLSSSGAPACQR